LTLSSCRRCVAWKLLRKLCAVVWSANRGRPKMRARSFRRERYEAHGWVAEGAAPSADRPREVAPPFHRDLVEQGLEAQHFLCEPGERMKEWRVSHRATHLPQLSHKAL